MTLTWWRWRLGQERPCAGGSRRKRAASHFVVRADFVEVIPTSPVVGDPRRSTALELAGGYRVRLSRDFSGEALTRLLDILAARQ
jgi:hypothetical protein